MNFTEAVQLAKSGNEAGYRYLYNATYQSKYYLALQYMKNDVDAQDVIQEAYIKAFANLHRLEQPEAFSSWLGRIVANTAKNELAKKNPLLFSDMGTEEQDEPFENQVEDENVYIQPELSYTRQETQELVHQLIDSLSDEQRICILMFHIEGASIKDIASALGCSENTVKSRLNYGRKNLKFKAEELQKKGWKLWGLAPVAVLGLLLHHQETAMAADGSLAAANVSSEAQIFQFVRTRLLPAGSPAGGAGAAAGTGGGFLSTVAGKILIGVAVAVIAGAGTGAGAVKLYFDSKDNTAIEESVPEEYVSDTSAPESADAPETSAAPETAEASETETVPETTPQTEETVSDEQLAENALKQYIPIINGAEAYDYGVTPDMVSGNYRYALVTLSQDFPIPALLLAQEDTSYLYHVRTFQYDHQYDAVIQPQEILTEGVGGVGFRASLALQSDGNGLMYTVISAGTGDTEIDRITLQDFELYEEEQWSGRMDHIPDEITSQEIIWHDINDLSALEEQLRADTGADAGGASETGEPPSSGSAPESQAPAQTEAAETSRRRTATVLFLPERSIHTPMTKSLPFRVNRTRMPSGAITAPPTASSF